MADICEKMQTDLPISTIKLCENVHEITCIAEMLLHSNSISIKNSRDLFWETMRIAKSFEETFNPKTGNYLTDIATYAENELLKAFLPDPCENKNIYFRMRDGAIIQAQLGTNAYDTSGKNGWSNIEIAAILPSGKSVPICFVDYQNPTQKMGRNAGCLRIKAYHPGSKTPLTDYTINLFKHFTGEYGKPAHLE